MGRVAKVVQELRAKYGYPEADPVVQEKTPISLTEQPNPVAVIPMTFRAQIIERIPFTKDELRLIAIALKWIADETDRMDLRPQYLATAKKADELFRRA